MLSVRVLGELALERDDVPLDLPISRRARSLLGLLALDRRLHPRSELAARFWPDVLDESARTSLRSALAALRKALEPDAGRYLVATRERVGLTDDVWTDAGAFEQHAAAGLLEDAAGLYRGDLLSGLDDDWIIAARDEWRDRAAGVLAQLAATAEQSGDWTTAIAHTRRIVALDPLAEEGQRALIRRLAQAGDRPAALATYARYADRLRAELRIAPSAATRAVVEDLRRSDPEPQPEVAPAVVTTAVAPRPTSTSTSASGTVTLLFTDLVGSTELLGELGEDGAERLRRDHFGLLRDVAVEHGGQEVKSLGDGLMVAFGSSTDAAACAIGIQQAVARHNQRAGNEHMRVRVGLNVGEPIRDEDDYFGTPVVVAKRLCDRADGGQILASELVRLLIGGRGDFTFRPVGELALKGLTQPVASCEIAWEPVGAQRIALPRELARDQGVLVGRADELALLQETWERTCGGRLGVVMVAGEPGIGKTRLVAEFCRRAQGGGATVLLGRCHEETAAPYEPFIEALRHYVASCPVDELRFQIGNRRKALSKLLPELDGANDEEGPAAADMSDRDAGERFALLDAVGSLVCETALTHPTILVLDDLHWADDASLLLVRHVARAAVDVPLLILGTYRETELQADGALSAALAELRRARAVEVLPLRGLEADDVAVLIRGLGADLPQDGAHAVARRTEGNPFFVEEMVRHLGAGGELGLPESVKDLVRRRLQGLGDPASRAIRAAAVLGREFDLGALERMVDDDGDDLLEAIDEALASSVLVEVADVATRFAFAHALIRETVYEQLSAARRARLHLRAGAALEELHARQLDDLAEQLAHHFVHAGDAEKSFEYQLRAARAAARVYAWEAAIVHQSAALETAERLALSAETDERVRRLLLERGSARHRQGDHEASLADFGRCLAAAGAAGDRHLQAEALDNLAFAEKPFDVARSSAHHDEALQIAQELGDAPLQISILGRMALSRANNLDLAGALEAGERALELAEGTGSVDDRKIAIDALKLVALQLGDLDRLGALTAELEEVERRQGDLWYLQWTLLEAAFVPIAHAQWDRATARLHEALAIHHRVGDVFAEPVLRDALCWLERSRGDLGTALTEGRKAVGLTDGDQPGAFSAWTRATLGWALLDARAVDEAITVLERGRVDAATLNDRFRVCGHLAWAYALAGAHAQADAAAEEAEAALAHLTSPAGGAFVFGFGAATALARAHLAAGRPQRGEGVLQPLLAAAEHAGWHEATAAATLVLGRCRAASDDLTTARALARRAADLAAEHALPGVAWEALAVLADLGTGPEASDLRARSAAVVQQLAAGLGDDGLAATFVLATER